MRNAAYAGLPLIANEFIGSTADIRDLMNTTFMGSGNGGIEAAIDSHDDLCRAYPEEVRLVILRQVRQQFPVH